MASAPMEAVDHGLFKGYDPGDFYDEMFTAPGIPRLHYAQLFQKLAAMEPAQFEERRKLADLAFLLQGITFTVYSDGRGTERLFPFDLIPRILPQSEWQHIDRGLAQHVTALNLFLQDVYGKQRIFKDKQVSRSLIYSCPHFRREMIGVEVPRDSHAHFRHRSRARFENWRVLLARRQRAHAERNLLRAGKPPGDDAHVLRRLSGLRSAAGRPLPCRAFAHPAQPLAARRGRSPDRFALNYHVLLEQSQQPYRLHWDPLITMAGEQERFRQFYDDANSQNTFEFLAFREENPSSIVQCIAKARENARTIRDRISREMWEDINGLFHTVTRFEPAEEIPAGPHRICETVKFGSHRFHGVTDATLPHDEGWEFLRVGGALERQEMTGRLVDVQYHNLLDGPSHLGAPDRHQWMAVLKSVGAFEAYHRQYHSAIEPESVAEMLILHPQHPRSIRFSTAEVHSGLRAISGSHTGSYSNEADRLAGKALERLRYAKIDEIFKQGLHSYLDEVQQMSASIGEAIARTFFDYRVAA